MYDNSEEWARLRRTLRADKKKSVLRVRIPGYGIDFHWMKAVATYKVYASDEGILVIERSVKMGGFRNTTFFVFYKSAHLPRYWFHA